MVRKKMPHKPLTFVEIMQKFIRAGISGSLVPNRYPNEMEEMPSLDERVKNILGIVNRVKKTASTMLFFVMYDITSNKVRHQVVKYLQRKGCTRVQRSIFLADLEMAEYEGIRKDLAEVQAVYDNKDSILIVPISTDYLRAMKIIGQKIEIDVIMHNKNTLFF